MTDSSGWQPLRKPTDGARSVNTRLTLSPFGRLARAHALGASGDGAVALALAGSIFFSVSPTAARTSIALYLLLTIAPFALVTPLIGPLIDRVRGGRRTMIVATMLGRTVLAVLMTQYIGSLLLFPLAFGLLVLQKTYSVAKTAMVPSLVRSDDELVEANSKLALLSAVAGMAGVAVGAAMGFLGGPAWAAGLAAILFFAATIQAFTLPRVVVATEGPAAVELEEVRGAMIRVSAVATGLLRAFVGFVTFLLAFHLRGADEGVDLALQGAPVGATTVTVRGTALMEVVQDPPAPFWYFGVVAAGAGAGALVGARLAPALRLRVREELVLFGGLVLTCAAGLTAAVLGGIAGAFVMAFGIGVGAAAGKLAFDSLVQRDAPDANYGRWFSRFEARFQMAWVVGAFVPVVIRFGGDDGVVVGYTILGVMAGLAAATYFALTRPRFRDRLRSLAPEPARPAPPPPPVTPEEPTTVMADGAATDTLAVGADPAPAGEGRPLPPPPPTADPPPAVPTAWELDIGRPVVSSVEGVEVDEPDDEV